MIERPIIFLDIESTGTDVANDRIIELSLVKVWFIGGSPQQEIKTKRFNPEMSIPESATAIHGITDEMVKDEKPFSAYAKAIHEFIKGCDLCGFNSNYFDLPMLNNEFLRSGIDWNFKGHELIDIGNIFKILNPRTLTAAVLQYCEREHIEAHSAEKDAIATMDVFFEMLNQHDLPKTVKELALYSNYDRPILDLSGKFTYDKDGEIVFTFGQHRGKRAKDYPDFLQWMIYKNFPADSVDICYELLGQKDNY